ncbi:MAG: hypothetical protein ACE5H4_15645 [Candidatus Thorarchaeota archaeon]
MIEEEPLSRLIRLRRYDELDDFVDQLLQESGWSEVAVQLKRIPAPDWEIVGAWQFSLPDLRYGLPGEPPHHITEEVLGCRPWFLSNQDIGWGVRQGTLRDGLVHILGLQIVKGIDLRFRYKRQHGQKILEHGSLDPFEDIQASSLEELRQNVVPVALDVLRSQAAEHRTFFLDVDAISDSVFAAAVPDIIETRKREIQGLSEESQPNDIVGTYYGFRILTEGSLQRTRSVGFARSALKALDEMTHALGGHTRLSNARFESWRREPSSWPEAWKGYDDLTQILLKAIMSVSIGGRKRWFVNGLFDMGTLGDSRALHLLHQLLELIPVRSDHLHNVLDAIGWVGHPSSFDHILPLAKKNNVGGRKALSAMALIRCPESSEHLFKVLKAGAWNQQDMVADRFWMTFDSRAEDALLALWNRVSLTCPPDIFEEIIEIRRAKKAIISLLLIGEDGRAILRRHPDVLALLIQREERKDDKVNLIRTLRCVEGLMEDPIMVKAIRELEPRNIDYTRFMTEDPSDWGEE